MDSGKLSGFLTKVGLTWNTLLRLFYALCGWLVIGTSSLIVTPIGSTPIGVLRKSLDWLAVPSLFTFDMERWCCSHLVLLNLLGFIVIAVSVFSSFEVGRSNGWNGVFTSIEAPAFLLGLLLWLQSGFAGWFIIVIFLIAWVINAFGLGIVTDFRGRFRHVVIPSDDRLFYDLFVWPATMLAALLYPILVIIRLLFDGMPSK